MKQVDYIIVGCGLAGIAFCEQLRAKNKTFIVFDSSSQQSSTVAGGLYNPVVLKRFTAVWKSREQLDLAIPYYSKIEQELDIKLDYKLPVYRLFNSVEEQNNWFTASDKIGLSDFLSTTIIPNTNSNIEAAHGYGEVLETGRIDTAKLIACYRKHLKSNLELVFEAFDYEALQINADAINYKNYNSKKIVFAEGFGIKANPYFNYLPLDGTKGQLLTIHAPDLKINYVLKSSVFLIPLGNDLYRLGATYERNDKTNTITNEAKEDLIHKLKVFLKCDFTIVKQEAGIRPSVKDRRALIGEHPKYKSMYILNGMGSRGVMIAPYAARQLYKYIELGESIDKEIDIARYEKFIS